MKKVEYWRWRYRDPDSGRVRRTTFQMSADEALAKHPDAERIEGTMLLREVDDDFVDTAPRVFRPGSTE